MDESLEREGYEHSNSLEFCQSCLVRWQEREVRRGITEVYCPVCDAIERTIHDCSYED